jgi:hypothetical protein
VRDTSSQAEARYRELLGEASPEERLEICAKLARASREMALAGLRRELGDCSAKELGRALFRRLYGPEQALPRALE